MAFKSSGRRKFAELVAYHILRNVNRNMLSSVMDGKRMTDKVREYSRAAAPSFQDDFLAVLIHLLHFC